MRCAIRWPSRRRRSLVIRRVQARFKCRMTFSRRFRWDGKVRSRLGRMAACRAGASGAGSRILFGWLFTTAAVSLGAPFWFDLLSRVAKLRGTGGGRGVGVGRGREPLLLLASKARQAYAKGELGPESNSRTEAVVGADRKTADSAILVSRPAAYRSLDWRRRHPDGTLCDESYRSDTSWNVMKLIDGVRYFTTTEVLGAAGISRQTLWRWRKDGLVPQGHRFRSRGVLFSGGERDQNHIVRQPNRKPQGRIRIS